MSGGRNFYDERIERYRSALTSVKAENAKLRSALTQIEQEMGESLPHDPDDGTILVYDWDVIFASKVKAWRDALAALVNEHEKEKA